MTMFSIVKKRILNFFIRFDKFYNRDQNSFIFKIVYMAIAITDKIKWQ